MFNRGVYHCGFQLDGEPHMTGLSGAVMAMELGIPAEEEVVFIEAINGVVCSAFGEHHPIQKVIQAIERLAEGNAEEFLSLFGYQTNNKSLSVISSLFQEMDVDSPMGMAVFLVEVREVLKSPYCDLKRV